MFVDGSRFKRMIFAALCLMSFPILLLMPTPGLADSSFNSTFVIDSLTFSRTDLDFSTVPGVPAAGTNQYSFSGAAVTLNGVPTDLASNSIDNAPWGSTSHSASLTGATGTVTGSASTTATANALGNLTAPASLSASAVGTRTGPGHLSVDVAQASLTSYGGFTVPTAGDLTITAAYHLAQSLANTDADTMVQSQVFGELLLYGFDAFGNPLNDPLASAIRDLVNAVVGVGTFNFAETGTLTLTVPLLANTPYDIVVDGVANGSTAPGPPPEPIPEPSTILLMGSGLLGLWPLRGRLRILSKK